MPFTKRILLLAGLAILVWLVVISLATLFRTTLGSERGRKWLDGKGAAQQDADALALKVGGLKGLDELRAWAVSALGRFDSGQLETNGAAEYWAVGNVNVAAKELPDVITQTWPRRQTYAGTEPSVTVMLTPAGKAQSIAICWYATGVIIGPSNFALPFSPWYSVTVQPGICVYTLKK